MSVDKEVIAINALRINTSERPVVFPAAGGDSACEGVMVIHRDSKRSRHSSGFTGADNGVRQDRHYELNS